jgi:hypothetical protein
MKDARWSDVLDAAAASAMHFRAAKGLFEQGGFDAAGDEGYRSRMAFLHAMLSGHTAFEDALLRILAILEEQAPVGPDWRHQLLIERVVRPLAGDRPAIIDAETAAAARDTRAFRHFATHAYAVDLIPERARPAVESGVTIADRIAPAILAFAETIDPG